jgi:hypothetical protein
MHIKSVFVGLKKTSKQTYSAGRFKKKKKFSIAIMKLNVSVFGKKIQNGGLIHDGIFQKFSRYHYIAE